MRVLEELWYDDSLVPTLVVEAADLLNPQGFDQAWSEVERYKLVRQERFKNWNSRLSEEVVTVPVVPVWFQEDQRYVRPIRLERLSQWWEIAVDRQRLLNDPATQLSRLEDGRAHTACDPGSSVRTTGNSLVTVMVRYQRESKVRLGGFALYAATQSLMPQALQLVMLCRSIEAAVNDEILNELLIQSSWRQYRFAKAWPAEIASVALLADGGSCSFEVRPDRHVQLKMCLTVYGNQFIIGPELQPADSPGE